MIHALAFMLPILIPPPIRVNPPTPAPTISPLAFVTATGTDPGGHPVCFKSQPGRGGKTLDLGWSLDILGAPGRRIAVLRCDVNGKLTLTHVKK